MSATIIPFPSSPRGDKQSSDGTAFESRWFDGKWYDNPGEYEEAVYQFVKPIIMERLLALDE